MKCDSDLLQEIRRVVDSEIRPSLMMDGGDISIISLDGNVLSVKLQGACSCCPKAMDTLKYGVEDTLKRMVSPEIVVNPVQ